VGLIKKRDTRSAWVGLVLSGLMIVLLIGVPFLIRCLF
jgi:hypothetical protein